MEYWFELVSLFVVSFFAATLLPAQSELLLAGLTLAGNIDVVILVSVATLGNVLGSVVNWFIGGFLLHYKDRKWFPVKEKPLKKAICFYQKWGIWSLLLAWMPIIGDPLTLVAGILKARLSVFLLLVAIGKAGRYVIVVWMV